MANLTGIGVSDECLQAFNEIKMNHKYRYVLFKISDDSTSIVIDKRGERSSSYDEFLESLPKKDGRYAVYDYEFKADDESSRNKLVFIVWAPDTAPVRRKMIIAGSRASIRNTLDGVHIEMQATDNSEIAEDQMLAKCKSGSH